MQLVYFQFRRFGILVPIVLAASWGIVEKAIRLGFRAKLPDAFAATAIIFLFAAALLFSVRWSVRRQPAQKLWNALEEEWEITNDVDEFMYLKLWHWAILFVALGCAFAGMGLIRK